LKLASAWSLHNIAGNTMEEEAACPECNPAHLAARATGAPKTEQFYLTGVPTKPTVTIPAVMPM
jgi:hypothetical protein